MMWVEVLSRHREIAARVRIAGEEARIGRGYDNDVIVDDPYVAARHLRVFRDETGQLVAEDLGSANGVYLDGGTSRLARIVVDGNQSIRIGQTYLRVRDVDHEVERERLIPSEARVLPIVLAAGLGAVVLGLTASSVWIFQTSEPRVSSYVTPLLTLIGAVFCWVGIWALLSRVFSGRARFVRNLVVALAGLVVFVLYGEFAPVGAFAWNSPMVRDYAYVGSWAILAAVCILHLREVSPSRLALKGGAVGLLFVAVIAVQMLQQSEAFSDSGRQTAARRLFPPAFRLAPLRDQARFFGDVAALRTRLDADRAQRPADAAGR